MPWSTSTYNPAGDAINAALAKQRRVKVYHPALPYRDLPAALQTVRESTAGMLVRLAFQMLAVTGLPLRGGPWNDLG